MNQTVVKVNPPRRASAVSVSTWLQLATNYRELARRRERAGWDSTILRRLAAECEHQANRLADFQAITDEVLEGILADIKAQAAERAVRWQP
jgi:hypothetical protein